MKRVLSGLVFLPIVFAIIFWTPPFGFSLLTATACIIGYCEFFQLASNIGIHGFYKTGMIMSFLLCLGFYFDPDFVLPIICLSILVTSLNWLFAEKNISVATDQIAYTLFGIIFVGVLLGHLILIRNLEAGKTLIIFNIAIVWGGDTAAYYGGRIFGKRPLAFLVSPKKTVEGSIFGIMGSLLVGLIANLVFAIEIPLNHCLIIALFCGMIGQFGDLTESMIKRNAKVKDSGYIIPGHGGILDRLDGLIFGGPFFYYYYIYVIG